jgi:hypothetical protein
VDLPYYDRLWLIGLRAIAGLEIRYADWGVRMHRQSPTSLALALLDMASNSGERTLALGFLTHVAVDVIFHCEIERRVKAEVDGTSNPDKAHKLIEDQMDLHVHHHILGHSGIGTSYARRMLILMPTNTWTELVTSALKRAHGAIHTKAQFRRCLRALGVFGIVYSVSPSPWVTTKPKEDPSLLKTALRLANEAIALSARYLEAGAAYAAGEIDREGFIEKVPDCSLIDGGEVTPT